MDGRVEGQADILTLVFLDPLLMVPLETATTQRQGAVGSLQVPPTAV
jgi:hypothetical protein